MSYLKKAWPALMLLLTGAPSALAQTDEQMRADLESCMQAVSIGDRRSFLRAAAAIQAWNARPDGPDLSSAANCLTQGFEGPWQYNWSTGRYEAAGPEAELAAERVREAALQDDLDDARLSRAQEAATVLDMSYRACGELLKTDRVSALTNGHCVALFVDRGLPD